jgi:preprotein translocase subunit Sec63
MWGWLLIIVIGYFVYRWWTGTDQTMFKTKYLPKSDRYGNMGKPHVTKQVRIDRILDKMSKSGYKSLTHNEKVFLDKQGK